MLEQHKYDLQSLFEEAELFFDEPMKDHTSFKIGGPAALLFIPSSIDHLKQMLAYIKDHQLPFYIMGNGSNLLVADEGFPGIIIQVYRNMSEVKIEGNLVKAEAGILLTKLAKLILNHNLSGFEFASGIPGTLGGAVYMNAGAYDGEIKDVLVDATILTKEGVIKTLAADDLDLSYRHSILMDRGDLVLSATMTFKEGQAEAIKAKMDDLNGRRKDKQPLDLPSAGSTFKRPEGYFAGKLIMDAGLRGYQIGGARVSDKHCGFVVNTGEATCEDVVTLIRHIQKEVKEQFGVTLETEVRLIGREL